VKECFAVNNTVYLLLKFFVSILSPFLLRYVEPDATWSMKTLLGISIFLGWSSFDILHYLRKIDGEHKRETELWLMEHDLDRILNNIRKHYREIVKDFYGKDDLFKDYFQERFSELAGVLQSAAERKELFVRDFHFQRTELLLSAFAEDATGVLRYVWIIRKGEPLFDEKWEHYCDQILKGTTAGAIKEVRALLVLGEGVNKDDRVIQRLAGFYDFAQAHNYQLIDEATYNRRKSDNRLETDYSDFGIYGRQYIYLTLSYGEVASGRFCKDAVLIERYMKFFDCVWDSHVATKLPKSSLAKVELTELFNLKW
jgi:hypothetical protein